MKLKLNLVRLIKVIILQKHGTSTNSTHKCKGCKNETDATPLTDRKNQAEINNLLLNLEKAKAKFDIDKAAKARESVINSNTEATTEEKQAALTKLQNKYNENKAEIDKLTISNDIAPLKESSISQINSINVTATKR